MYVKTALTMTTTVTVSFYVRKQAQKKTGLYPILMRVSFGGERITIGQIGLCISSPSHIKQNVIMEDCPQCREYNTLLQREVYAVEQIADELFANSTFSMLTLKEKYLLSKNRLKPLTICECYREYLDILTEKCENGKMALVTLRKWKNGQQLFTMFLRERYGNTNLSIRNLNEKLYDQYESFLINDFEYHRNTATRFLIHLKAIARYSVKRGYVPASQIEDCKAPVIPSHVEPLSFEDFKKIESADFTKVGHNLTKDMFLFACYTGLSYIDIKTLRKCDIKEVLGAEMIIKDRVKTKVESDIPLIEPAKAILDKYASRCGDDDTLLPVYSNQKLNLYLKEIAEVLGIKTRLTFHVARHTFATFNLDMGVTMESVSKMLGHTDIRTTRVYAKITQKKIRTEIKLFADGINKLSKREEKTRINAPSKVEK